MVLTSTEQLPLSLLFAVQTAPVCTHISLPGVVLSQLQTDFGVQGQQQNHSDSQGCRWASESCRAWGKSGADAAEFHQEPLQAAVEPQHQSSATLPGCVCNSTHKDSQRSHGINFTPKIKRFQGCSIHKNTFILNVMNSLTKRIYKLLPNIQHISDIKDSRIEFSNT